MLNYLAVGGWEVCDIMAHLLLEILGASWDMECQKFCAAMFIVFVFGVQVHARLYQVMLSVCNPFLF